MQFTSFGAFALHLVTLQSQQLREQEKGLEKVATAIEKTAKSELGVYQPAAGPFSAWPALAESTKEDRSAKGFPADEPLLRTGTLRNSISHQVKGSHAAVGSTSEVMVAQELGTARIPPRPVLGPAAIRNKKVIQKVLGRAVLNGLLPPGHPAAANYNDKV